ncbi:MAG: MFS transporter [Bacteroidota bacterium]
MKQYVTKIVLILSLVSFFADIASEMLYPILPGFLASIGFTAFGIGVLEAVAKLVSGLGKTYFGALSDQLDRRVPFIRLGYLLSAIAKPLMGLFPQMAPVFAARLLDRVGKGTRGAPRDALLVAESMPENRGKVFGFHRGMDTLGAVIGPLLVLSFIAERELTEHYEALFLLAFIPAIIGVGLTFLLPVPPKTARNSRPRKPQPLKGIFAFWREASPEYQRILAGVLLFALINSTDMLLLLRAAEIGFSPYEVIFAYVLYNLVYAALSLPFGKWGDRFGFKVVFLISVLLFSGCYLALGSVENTEAMWGIFVVYGAFTAANDGSVKSWLSLHIPTSQRATGLGLYGFLEVLGLALASAAAGAIWKGSSGKALFLGVGVAGFVIFFLLLFIFPAQPKS